jgi:fermentation-respiration switch protein FrsA (DUF1100 family)
MIQKGQIMNQLFQSPLFLKATMTALCLMLLMTGTPVAHAQQATSCLTTVVVRAGDTLSSIAAATLGNPAAYARIVAATNAAAQTDLSFARIANPGAIAIGWKLCIPAAQSSQVAVPSTSFAPATPLAADSPTQVDEDLPEVDGERLTIDYLRSLDFPGSDLVIEEELAAGVNYRRYIASYLSDGLRIDGLLTVPNGEPPTTGWPAIVFNHGYIPPEVYRTAERYVAYVDGFARNGYIVFKPDYRGHGFSEGEATGAYGSPNYAVDVLNAVATMKRYAPVDENRIGMWGHSMGGYLTLRAMVVNDDIKAGVIWAGVVASYKDLLERWNRRNTTTTIPQRARRWRQQLVEKYGDPTANPAFWASISANSYVSDLSGPIQLHHGTEDESVPVEFSELLYDEIAAVGGAADLFTYEGDNHNLSGQFNAAMRRSIEFFDRYVKNAVQ